MKISNCYGSQRDGHQNLRNFWHYLLRRRHVHRMKQFIHCSAISSDLFITVCARSCLSPHDSHDSHKQPSSYSFLQLLLWFRTWTWSIHAQNPHPHLAQGSPWRWKLISSFLKPFPDTPKQYRRLSRVYQVHMTDYLTGIVPDCLLCTLDGDETTK